MRIEVKPINLTRKEQILQLNTEVKCTIRLSSVHGIGVVALRDIQKGEKCYLLPKQERSWYTLTHSALNELRPEIKEIILERWASVINGSYFQSPNDEVWLPSFINHSNIPNYEQNTDSAMRDIKEGEEVVENYRVMDNAEEIYPFLK